MRAQKIKNIMKKNIATVQCQTSLKDIIKTLLRSKQEHLPVVNASHKLIGMVSQIDCHKALLISGYHCDKPVKVNDIMTSSYLTLSPDDSISEVTINSLKSTVNLFPVVENEKLVGIVNRVDLLTILNENLSLCEHA